jgi:dTDP-4-dehydrorhamnose reductase
MATLLILGSQGQLGRDLTDLLEQTKHTVHSYSRATLSIDDYEIVQNKIVNIKPDYVINCGAYTKVDLAEKEILACMKTNGYAVGHLAKSCQVTNSKLIHISSDYVYDNNTTLPINEDDATNPRSIYALSKLIGDNLAMKYNDRTIILRTSWVYSSYGHNFVKTMLKLAEQKDHLTIVDDQVGCPTYSGDLAKVILHIIDHIENNPNFKEYGIYNYANEGVTNWKEFAEQIFKIIHKEIKLSGTSTQAYNAPTPRPLWSVMDLSKIKKTFVIEIPYWTESLSHVITKITAQEKK